MSSSSHDERDKIEMGDKKDDREDDSVDAAKLSNDRMNFNPSLAKQPWYWPYTTRDESERRLAGQPDGTFLIRDCSVPGDFTLTVREAGGNKCVRIYKHRKGYSLSPTEPEAPFSSLPDLVEFYGHHSLASFNKRLDVCLRYPLAKPTSAGSNQYGVFKELYDLSQDQLSAQTRLTVLHQQHSQLDQKIKLFEMMTPALRLVQGMYYDSMKLQEEWGPRPPKNTPSAADGSEPLGESEQTERLRVNVLDNPGMDGKEGEYRMSKAEEKSFTANTRLLMSRHTSCSEKLHIIRSNYDVEVVKLRDLEAELQHVELTVLRMKRRQEELIRQMVEMGCQKEYLSQVLESRVATREFDRSTWLVDCSRDEALAQLEGLPHGAFLIRHKDKRHLPFVLSIVISGDCGPRTVQHVYIVRPHGRGYGFNAALAVFESVDQLVLRHRYVSFKHYFKTLDVMLTFPVGCQELLRRSLSESDKESVRVKEGEYANAEAILQHSMTDGIYEVVGGSSEGSDQSGDSSELQDSLEGAKFSSGAPSAEKVQSGSMATCLKRNEYESVKSSEKSGSPTVASGVSNVMKEHIYEDVDASEKIGDSSSMGEVRVESKYETIGRSEKSADTSSTRDRQEETRESIGTSEKNVNSGNTRENQDLDRESKYETIGRSEKNVNCSNTREDQDFDRESKYETIGRSKEIVDSSSARDRQEVKREPTGASGISVNSDSPEVNQDMKDSTCETTGRSDPSSAKEKQKAKREPKHESVGASEKSIDSRKTGDGQDLDKESKYETIQRSNDSSNTKDKKEAGKDTKFEIIGASEKAVVGSSNMQDQQEAEMEPKFEPAGASENDIESSKQEAKSDPKYENIGASERSVDSSKTKDRKEAKLELKCEPVGTLEENIESSNTKDKQEAMRDPTYENVGAVERCVDSNNRNDKPETKESESEPFEVLGNSAASSDSEVTQTASKEPPVGLPGTKVESSEMSTSYVSEKVKIFERLSMVNIVEPDSSIEASEMSVKSVESSKMSASQVPAKVHKTESLSAIKSVERSSSAESLEISASHGSETVQKFENLSAVKTMELSSKSESLYKEKAVEPHSSVESSKISASHGSETVQKHESLSAVKTVEAVGTNKCEGLSAVKTVEAVGTDKCEGLSAVKTVEAVGTDKCEGLSAVKSVEPARKRRDQSEENPYEHVGMPRRSRQTTV